MASRRLTVGLLWSQFSAYHVDRINSVVSALDGEHHVLACEIARSSRLYAWRPSGDVDGVTKITLFSDRAYEDVHWTVQMFYLLKALWRVDILFVGVSYAEIQILITTYILRIFGKRLIMMTESKFDDLPRKIEKEILKPFVFWPYHGALVGGRRQADYVRLLGFRRRKVVLGYDCVGLDRVLDEGNGEPAPGGPSFESRPFIFVGRFVNKKNIPMLLSAYAGYVAMVDAPREMVLVGDGPLREDIVRLVESLGLARLIHFEGFCQSEKIAALLSKSLALIVSSSEEQWGLVVNEALAFNLPIILTENVGARDLLVRNLINGFVIEPDNVAGMATAMKMMSGDKGMWLDMVSASSILKKAGDSVCFGRGVAQLLTGA